MEVSLRGLPSLADQGDGPEWRIRGADDDDVCRFNQLEENFRLDVVIGGERKQLAMATISARAKPWSRIRVEPDADRIRCLLDVDGLLEATDATLPEAGVVGLCTKADARTASDALVIQPR